MLRCCGDKPTNSRCRCARRRFARCRYARCSRSYYKAVKRATTKEERHWNLQGRKLSSCRCLCLISGALGHISSWRPHNDEGPAVSVLMDTIVDWKAKDGPGRVISTECHGHKDKTHGMIPSLKLLAQKIAEQTNMLVFSTISWWNKKAQRTGVSFHHNYHMTKWPFLDCLVPNQPLIIRA